MDLSGIGSSFDADAQARVFMGMGTVDEQMACRAQRALMRRLTHGFSSRGDRDHKPSVPGGQPASFAASFSCLCLCSFSECTPSGADPFDTLFAGPFDTRVADCASAASSAVMRERVEAAAETPMTGRKVTSRRSRSARLSVSHGTLSDESSDEKESRDNLKGPGNICLCMSIPC